jgi:hypothetical protein
MSHPVIIGLHRWSASGVLRRFCTIIRWENSPAILPWRAGWNLSSEQAAAELIKSVPGLLAANKCPDFVEDKGHYFGTDLPDSD